MAKRARSPSPNDVALLDSPPIHASGNTPESARHDLDESRRAQKHTHLDHRSSRVEEFICDLAPHAPLSFRSYTEYETHYLRDHTNRCSECHKNFPSEHFLTLHITENHDPFTAIKRDQGEKIFACFVENCSKVCGTWYKRRSHLVDKHKFPKEFDFFIVNDGIDGRSSMLRPDSHVKLMQRSKNAQPKREAHGSNLIKADQGFSRSRECRNGGSGTPNHVSSSSNKTDVDVLSNSLQSLKFVPNKIRFGNHKGPLGKPKG
ncbi:hypothetical protein ANO11243_088400 [Dothideomycetidae sp. 11243]|nr:hypothetical protein ANO11243_088400 [fungal sp. No.11243]